MSKVPNQLTPFKKGQSGNPKGRPKGRKSFSTLFEEALVVLGEKNGKEPTELELEIIQKGVAMARKGDFKFYKDTMDRLHGTAVHKSESKEEIVLTELTEKEKKSLLGLINK